MSHYLVTGAAGFIAARVSAMLIAAGHTVIGVDNMNDAYDVRMKTYRLKELQKLPGFTFHQLDIADRSIIEQLKAGQTRFDAVINLAARAGVRASLADPWTYLDTNMTGTLNLLELCRQTGIPKFILASTSSIYGNDAPLPTPETADSDHPLQPYAATKKGAEAMCHAYHYLFDIDVSIVRYFTVYGPAGRPDMVMFRFAQWISEGHPVKINGDGEQSRGFTYIDDIARGTILALKPLGYEIINLGGHQTISINQLLQMFEEKIGRKAIVEYLPRHPADAMANNASVEKAGRLLGWEPQFSLEEGVNRLIDWYNQERTWVSQVHTS